MNLVSMSGTEAHLDAIKSTRPDGSEYWSADDLGPLLGYVTREKFGSAIDRARTAAANQGASPEDHFRGAVKVIPGGRWGSQTIHDTEMSRFGAYLVAMNGDPRKEEIAHAQAYFAVRTRQAEVAEQASAPRELTGQELMAKALIEADRTIKARDAELEQARPKVAEFDAYMSADGTYSMQATAKILGLGPNTLFRKLRKAGVLIAKEPNRNVPYQRYMHHFDLKVSRYNDSEGDLHVTQTTRVRPSGLPFLRRKLAELDAPQQMEVSA